MATLVPKKTREMIFTEVMDKIKKLFYKPGLGKDNQYCCQSEQIKIIKKLEEDLDMCEGDRMIVDANNIPKIEIDYGDKNLTEILKQQTIFNFRLSSKDMYICIILYYYITSPNSVNQNFHLLHVLRQLLPGKDAQTIIVRTSMAKMINQRLLLNKGNSPECEAIISKFKRDLMTLDIAPIPKATAVDFSQFTPSEDDMEGLTYPPIGYTPTANASPYSRELRYDGIYFQPYDGRLDSIDWIPEFDELTILTTKYDQGYKKGSLPPELKPEYNRLRYQLYSLGQIEKKSTLGFKAQWRKACLDMRQFLDQFEGGVSFTNKPLFKEIITDPKSLFEHKVNMGRDSKGKSSKIFWGGIKRRKHKTRSKNKK